MRTAPTFLKGLPFLALRNLSRNYRATVLTILEILFSVGLVIFGSSWINGVMNDMINTSTALTGHVRIASGKYLEKERLLPLRYSIPWNNEIERQLESLVKVQNVLPRIKFGAYLSCGDEDSRGMGIGVKTVTEKNYILSHVINTKGEIPDNLKGGILLGDKIAEELGIAEQGPDVTLLGRTAYGSVTAMRLEVKGILDFDNGGMDRLFIVGLSDAMDFLDMEGRVSEICLFGETPSSAKRIADEIEVSGITGKSGNDRAVVRTWKEEGAIGNMYMIMKKFMAVIALFLVLIAAAGVMNTMMMSVMERTGEIGVMAALGLTKSRIVMLILMEAVWIGSVGALGGAVPGIAAGLWLQKHGIYLGSKLTSGMPVPLGNTIHGHLSLSWILGSMSLGLAMALIGALVPALKAASLNPAEGMRRINK